MLALGHAHASMAATAAGRKRGETALEDLRPCPEVAGVRSRVAAIEVLGTVRQEEPHTMPTTPGTSRVIWRDGHRARDKAARPVRSEADQARHDCSGAPP